MFRVTGRDGMTGEARRLYVRAADAETAAAFARRRRVPDAEATPVDEGEAPEGAPVLNADAGPAPFALEDSPLLRRPVMSIALGIFLGLVLFWLLMAVFWLFASAVFFAPGGFAD